ncbi:MAG: response regulator [Anaerolineae bacterium]|nr:response regulator [Anaerolineae bacterium]
MAERQTSPLVLVADDEIHTTHMLELIFEREGYRVECTNDGVSALEAARRLMPDLILLDIQMPGMNGFDVLRGLRENAMTANIPTILITAKAMKPSDVAHGLELGADDYLSKPFAPLELIARAESKMKARQLEEMLQQQNQALEALLRTGEELNQTLETDDLPQLILFLALDLLFADVAAIFRFDQDGHVVANRIQTNSTDLTIDPQTIIDCLPSKHSSVIWPGGSPIIENFQSGMAVPLEHSRMAMGILMVASNKTSYDENSLRLLRGIGKQASLALRNAELYEMLALHAEHLEDMVAARTAELESAQQMLIRSEKLASIGHLAASIAHEINNPLQPILIHLEHMMEDAQDNEPIDIRAVESIQASIGRITRIVSQLLEFTGKRSNDSDVRFIDIGHTLQTVINLNRKLFEQSSVVLNEEMGDLPSIYGSKDQLEQVFMNMVLNAHAAMHKGDSLTIRSWAEENSLVIQFQDTGTGIDPDHINKIFDPFFSTKEKGTGLGLFVSYGIIQNHQGTIEVESKVNVGTTFTIRLPIDAQPES